MCPAVAGRWAAPGRWKRAALRLPAASAVSADAAVGVRRRVRSPGDGRLGWQSRGPTSSASIRLACCSTARKASQLANVVTSRVRCPASNGPLSVTATSGRMPARTVAGLLARSRSAALRMCSLQGRLLRLSPRSAPSDRAVTLSTKSWPAAIMTSPSADGITERALPKRRIHPVADPRRVDRQASVDVADHGAECRRIEAKHASVLQLEIAAALERADQCDRAAAAAFEIDVQRKPSATTAADRRGSVRQHRRRQIGAELARAIPSGPRWKISRPATRPPARAPSISSIASSDRSNRSIACARGRRALA